MVSAITLAPLGTPSLSQVPCCLYQQSRHSSVPWRRLYGSRGGVIISARHLRGITVTAGAVPLFLGQEVCELESGAVERFFLCGGLDGLRSHQEMPPRGPEHQRCLEMPRSGEKKQFKACVEMHFTILAFNICAHTPQ